jgi:ribosomal protein S21
MAEVLKKRQHYEKPSEIRRKRKNSKKWQDEGRGIR